MVVCRAVTVMAGQPIPQAVLLAHFVPGLRTVPEVLRRVVGNGKPYKRVYEASENCHCMPQLQAYIIILS